MCEESLPTPCTGAAPHAPLIFIRSTLGGSDGPEASLPIPCLVEADSPDDEGHRALSGLEE